MEAVLFSSYKLNHGHPDGIGSPGAANSEYASRRVVQKGTGYQCVFLDQMKMVEEDEMGEALDVFQTLFEFREDVYMAFQIGPEGTLDGDAFGFLEGRMNDADGFKNDRQKGSDSAVY